MIIRNCTTMQILFDYLVGRPKTEDGRIPSFNFFEIFLKLFSLLVRKRIYIKNYNWVYTIF
jgi:hypothetical protein